MSKLKKENLMKTKTKIIACLMALLLVSALFAACDNTPKTVDKTDKTGAPENSGTGTAPVTEINKDSYEYAKSRIPDVKFDGAELRILISPASTAYDPANAYRSRNVYTEELIEVPINDAVYERNQFLESALGIVITPIQEANPTEALRKSCAGNLDTYDFAFLPMNAGAGLATANYLIDLKSVNGLALDEVWWDQSAIKELSIGDKLYITASDGDILDKQTTWGTMFNKRLIEDTDGLEIPYTTVLEGNWTADKYIEYSKAVKDDLNGDGKYDANDKWGIITENNSIVGFYFGFGGYIAKKNEEDIPEFDMTNARAASAIEKAFEIVLNGETTIRCEKMTGQPSGVSVWLHASTMFTNDQALFRSTDLNSVERWRAMDADFGIIPMPKLDKDQEYYSCGVATGTGTGVCIPTTNTDLDFTGICLEAFVSASRYTLREGYYESTLGGIISRDDESRKMLDIIFQTRHFDLGYIFDWGGMGYLLRTMGDANNTNFASEYDKKIEAAQKAMDETLAAFDLA